ncbi:MAG: hypothetical protein Q8L15_03190 [Methylobacter sp.]|nr:hypothetical protein [Methylobacter sp.]
MIGIRTRYSLVQYLGLQSTDSIELLIEKHGITADFGDRYVSAITVLKDCLLSESDGNILSLVEEIARTSSSFRGSAPRKGIYDERFDDLYRCLQLDGYEIENKKLIQLDPSISDARPLDDDLLEELKNSGLDEDGAIENKINASSESFRSSPANYNACLNDIRVALETLAKAIAATRQSSGSPPYDLTKWGSVLGFLRNVGFITLEEERGLAGVYGFVSPGSHRPMGLSEEQTARLGRSLALGMCWFLIKSYRASLNH